MIAIERSNVTGKDTARKGGVEGARKKKTKTKAEK